MESSRIFDVIVVGGGHAGTEAAAAAARLGARVALISFDRDAIGAMSCNPAIGGLGKGHLMREVDALDGWMARAADRAAIHYRMLNASKGAAVQGPRIQADRRLYREAVQALLAAEGGITVISGEAAALKLSRDGTRVEGVELANGGMLNAPAVVLATGTFLGGRIFRGEEQMEGGRIGEAGAPRLAVSRLRTGEMLLTPRRSRAPISDQPTCLRIRAWETRKIIAWPKRVKARTATSSSSARPSTRPTASGEPVSLVTSA